MNKTIADDVLEAAEKARKHEGRIEDNFTGYQIQAKCSCGWAGTVRINYMAAQMELQGHYKEFLVKSK